MINIKEMSREFTNVEKYLMTLDKGINTLKDVEDNTSIPVAGYITFVDEREDKDPVEILSIITPDNVVYSCQSVTFKRSFHDIADMLADKSFAIQKISGTTKAGRPYIDCKLDVGSII